MFLSILGVFVGGLTLAWVLLPLTIWDDLRGCGDPIDYLKMKELE